MKEIQETVALLGNQILSSETYRAFKQAQDVYQADPTLGKLVTEFDACRDALVNARAAEDKDMRRIETLQTQMQQVYAQITANEVMKRYNEAGVKFDGMLKEVYAMLNTRIFGKAGSDCGGSCAACSGCH